jgi:hypothetical protein
MAAYTLLVVGCTTPPQPKLDHHAAWETFPQANSPSVADCENGKRDPYYVDVPGGTGSFFLYCFGPPDITL